MTLARDLTGRRFGKLVAIRPTEKRIKCRVVWECQCDCGNIAFVSSENLIGGNTRSCGCLKKEAKGSKYKDLTGQRFGRLVAVRPLEERKNHKVMWECQCDCGNTTCVRSASLLSGNTRSCGCEKKAKAGRKCKDLTGQRFGKLVALRPTERRINSRVVWECQCDCGHITYVPSVNLISGNTQSCGCGQYRNKI